MCMCAHVFIYTCMCGCVAHFWVFFCFVFLSFLFCHCNAELYVPPLTISLSVLPLSGTERQRICGGGKHQKKP